MNDPCLAGGAGRRAARLAPPSSLASHLRNRNVTSALDLLTEQSVVVLEGYLTRVQRWISLCKR